MELDLLPCVGCKLPRVLKLGDYCKECALEPEPYYVVVKPDTLEQAAKASGMAREFLNAKQEKAFENYQSYVVYYVDGKWQDILINEWFPVPLVMKNLFDNLSRETP